MRAESDTTVRRSGTSYNVHLPGSTSSVRVSGARYITENPSPSVMMADNDLDSSLMMVGSGAYSSASQKPAVNEQGEAIHYGFAVSGCLYGSFGNIEIPVISLVFTQLVLSNV
jgi:hypothetical protein